MKSLSKRKIDVRRFSNEESAKWRMKAAEEQVRASIDVRDRSKNICIPDIPLRASFP